METRMMRLFLCALTLFLFGTLSWSAPATGKTPDGTLIMQLPKSVADSLPWFAIREMKDNNPPFTKSSLMQLASKSDRTAMAYFATWCIPCKAGVRKLVESRNTLKKHGVQVLLLNVGERDEKKIKNWVSKIGADVFTVVMDPFKRTTEGFGLGKENEEISLPRTILLDRNAKPMFMLGEEGTDWPSILWK